jgi:hypothetical protein
VIMTDTSGMAVLSLLNPSAGARTIFVMASVLPNQVKSGEGNWT